MKRNAIVIVAAKGARKGKPRPALVVQFDLFHATHANVNVCPVDSDVLDAPPIASRGRLGGGPV